MQKRQYIILAILAVVIIGTKLTMNKFDEHGESKKKKRTVKEFKIETKVLTVKNASYPAEVNLTGRVKSIDRIELYAEVSGVLKKTPIRFKEGNSFKKGQTLIHLDDEEMRWQLMAKKSSFINTITKLIPDLKLDYTEESEPWIDYLEKLDPKLSLPALPVIKSKKLNYFIAGRGINDAFFEIKSQEIKLAKHRIVAPFNGIVKKSNITQGSLVRLGQVLGEFIASDGYEVEAAVSFPNLKFIKKGQTVDLSSSGTEQVWQGEIYRIGDVINEATQTVNVYIKIKDKGVKEGMYLSGFVQGEKIEKAYALPRILLLAGDRLNIVEDGKLKTIAVNVVKVNRDEVLVDGLADGVLIIDKILPKTAEGTLVEVIE